MNEKDARKEAIASSVACPGCGALSVLTMTSPNRGELDAAAESYSRMRRNPEARIYLEPIEDAEEWMRLPSVYVPKFHS